MTLIRQWIDDGSLPSLKALCERGTLTPLRSSADWLVGSPWPTFYTGTPPAEHGLFHYLLWDPATMTNRRPSPDWLPLRPFWRRLGERGRRVIAVDVPMAYAPEPMTAAERAAFDEGLRARVGRRRRVPLLIPAIATAAAAVLLWFAVFDSPGPIRLPGEEKPRPMVAGTWEDELFLSSDLSVSADRDESEALPEEYLAIASVFLDG